MSDVLAGGVIVVAIVMALVLVGALWMVTRLYRKVEQGKALIISTMRSVKVTFTGQVVLPIVHKAEIMDISVKTIDIDRRGAEGLICRDNIRADIKVTFFVKVNKTAEDVIKVAQSIGCARASDRLTLDELFNAKFAEALKTVGKQLDFVDLYTKRNEFRDHIINVIGTDLNGYVLEDAAIDYLEQTPVSALDPKNILDAQGIRKITELTAVEAVRTNEYRNTERKQITKQDVEATEAILELQRQQADAEARANREIETVRARESAEILRIQAEERLKHESARLTTDQQVGVQQQNLEREVAVASLNRDRVVAVEKERIEKDRQLEVIARDREVELQTIAKDKEVEVEKRNIADVVRERVAVDKTVVEQEEAIKRLQTVEEANRDKEAVIIAAEAQAQEALVKDIKAAEAAEQSAIHRAAEQIKLAEAELQSSDLTARAKIRLAEGIQAESAAAGLADVQVKQADAEATEAQGLVQAKVAREIGAAEGAALEARLLGEANGLSEKATAMQALDESSRGHEEYRMRIDALKEVQLSEIEARRQVAESQAEVIAKGLERADIDIIGGDAVFFDRLAGAITMGKAVDGAIEHSSTAQALLGGYLDGSRDLPADIRQVLADLPTEGLRDLTLTALLTRMLARGGETDTDGGGNGEAEGRERLNQLLVRAKELGIGDVRIGDISRS
ncbi:MAG: flotillin family protein [Acidimicrobiales bacterium]